MWGSFEITGGQKILLAVNGEFSAATYKDFFTQPNWDFDEFLNAAGRRLGMSAACAFNVEGTSIDDCSFINDGDIIFISSDTTFIPPPSISASTHGDEASSLPSVVGPYAVGNFLGRGGFGEVRMGVHQFSGARVALKFASKATIGASLDSAQRSLQESQVLTTLRHKNVINMLSREESSRHVVLVFELMEGGDLREYLMSRGPTAGDARLSDADANMVFLQLVAGVNYAHMQRILHRDLKLENIFLLKKGTLVDVKIGDFGLSSFYRNTSTTKTLFDGYGTLYILPPEVFDKSGPRVIGPEFDVWALGVCLYSLLHGRLPFGGPDLQTSIPPAVIKQRIIAGQYTVDTSTVSPPAHDLVARMLCPSPADRITIADIVAHPWLHGSIPESPLVSPVRPGIPTAEEPLFMRADSMKSTTTTTSEGIPDSIDDILSSTTKNVSESVATTRSTTHNDSWVRMSPRRADDLSSRSSLLGRRPGNDVATSDDSSTASTALHAGGGAGGLAGSNTVTLLDELDKSIRSHASMRSSAPSPHPSGLDRVDVMDALSGSFHGSAAADDVFDRSEHGTVRLVSRIKPPMWARIDEDAVFDESAGAYGGSGIAAAAAAKPVPRRRLTAPEIVRSRSVSTVVTPDRFAELAATGGGGGVGGSDKGGSGTTEVLSPTSSTRRRHSSDFPRSLNSSLHGAGSTSTAKNGPRQDTLTAAVREATMSVSQRSAGEDGRQRPSATSMAGRAVAGGDATKGDRKATF
jgi:hypothetical protein